MTATTTSFLADITAVVERGTAGGAEAFADRPVFAMPLSGAHGALEPVQRVGLTPLGQVVILFGTDERSALPPGLILPPRLGGDARDWMRVR